MSDDATRAVDAHSLPERVGIPYPKPYDEPCRGRIRRALGDPFGLSTIGIGLSTLQPGAWSSQRHWHTSEDEFVFVVSGTPTLVTDDGEFELGPGMCAGFKAGVENGHHLVNRSDQPASYIEMSSRKPGADDSHYPDIDMVNRNRGLGHRPTRRDGTPFDE